MDHLHLQRFQQFCKSDSRQNCPCLVSLGNSLIHILHPACCQADQGAKVRTSLVDVAGIFVSDRCRKLSCCKWILRLFCHSNEDKRCKLKQYYIILKGVLQTGQVW